VRVRAMSRLHAIADDATGVDIIEVLIGELGPGGGVKQAVEVRLVIYALTVHGREVRDA
jgi:hypothetical protein